MNQPQSSTKPELLILAPTPDHKAKYTFYIRCLVDAGVWFPFGPNDELPATLPEDFAGLRCIIMDPAWREEYSAHAGLQQFQRDGGYVYYPELERSMGGSLGDMEPRHRIQRVINTAGLRAHHPRMIEALQQRNESGLVEQWKAALLDDLHFYIATGKVFCDPPGFISFRAAFEAAEYFGDETLAEPMREIVAGHVHKYGHEFDSCGGRYLLQLFERTGERQFLEVVQDFWSSRDRWRLDGVYLNCDLTVPPGCDADNPPTLVRENAWTWPETAANFGDTLAYLSKVTGEPHWQETAVRHVLSAHRWLFDHSINLWQHVGRPSGPDKRSAPWGRGNCWFLYAIRGLLDDLPAAHPARPELAGMLLQELEGLLRFQDEHGLWNNVLDAAPHESRPCSSATSRILHVYARAYSKGWLRDERIPPMLEKAWAGLLTKVWDTRLLAYCVGTSHGLERQVYLSRPHDSFRVSRSELLLSWMELQRARRAYAA